jgi:hypothetical protein
MIRGCSDPDRDKVKTTERGQQSYDGAKDDSSDTDAIALTRHTWLELGSCHLPRQPASHATATVQRQQPARQTRDLSPATSRSCAIQASRRAAWSRSVPGTPFSSTEPISTKDTGAASAASTTAWLTSTSPGLAYSAILAARFTVRPE